MEEEGGGMFGGRGRCRCQEAEATTDADADDTQKRKRRRCQKREEERIVKTENVSSGLLLLRRLLFVRRIYRRDTFLGASSAAPYTGSGWVAADEDPKCLLPN